MTARAVEFSLDPDKTGYELAQHWLEQRQPGGFFERLRVEPTEVSTGRMVLRCEIDEGHANLAGLVHGGVTASLIDMGGGGAAMTLIGAGETILTSDLAVRYLAPGRLDRGPFTATGHVSHRSGRRMVAQVEVLDATGTVLAEGSIGVAIRARSVQTGEDKAGDRR